MPKSTTKKDEIKKTTKKTRNSTTKKRSVNTKSSKKKIQKVTKEVRTEEKSSTNKIKLPFHHHRISKENLKIWIVSICLLGILLIFSTYAWLSTALNVKVKNFNMVVTKTTGLTISFDAINYGAFIEIGENSLINQLRKVYPNNTNQWAGVGLTPVSSNGIPDNNTENFSVFASGGVRYKTKEQNNGFISTKHISENKPNSVNYYIAFDLFLKNDSESPYNDNIYLDADGTELKLDEEQDKEIGDDIPGLVNSFRVGFVKIGSVPLGTDPTTTQNIKCNNNCEQKIYEPNNTKHSPLSIERAKEYDLNLVDGTPFPTYACIRDGGPVYVEDTISGSPYLDQTFFKLQNTVTNDDFMKPLFSIPTGVTKFRVYVWIEGQDIDSLETYSKGANVSISLSISKDTSGYMVE